MFFNTIKNYIKIINKNNEKILKKENFDWDEKKYPGIILMKQLLDQILLDNNTSYDNIYETIVFKLNWYSKILGSEITDLLLKGNQITISSIKTTAKHQKVLKFNFKNIIVNIGTILPSLLPPIKK